MKKLIWLILLLPILLTGSKQKEQWHYELPFRAFDLNDSIPTINQFGQIRNGIIVDAIVTACNADPSGVKLTPVELDYIRALVGGMYVIGTWQNSNAVYGIVGGNAFKHKFNWKDPRDLDVAFRLVFFNNPIHNATGVVWNGSNQYANTFLTPSATLSNTSTHLSYYTPTNNISSIQIPIGSINASNNFLQLNLTSANYLSGGVNSITAYTPASTNGYTIGTRTSINSQSVFYKGNKIATNSFSGDLNLSTLSLFIGGRNTTSGLNFPSIHVASFASIGAGFTDKQAIQQSQIVTYSQTILGRQ
jgi:hypothetical protein